MAQIEPKYLASCDRFSWHKPNRYIHISQKKARTARYFNMDTGEIGKLSQPGAPLYNIEHSNNGLISFPGGVCIKDAEGNIIGAIGVSGSTVEDDHAVATAGAKAV